MSSGPILSFKSRTIGTINPPEPTTLASSVGRRRSLLTPRRSGTAAFCKCVQPTPIRLHQLIPHWDREISFDGLSQVGAKLLHRLALRGAARMEGTSAQKPDLVEAAGVEPASEKVSREKTTCVSGSLVFDHSMGNRQEGMA